MPRARVAILRTKPETVREDEHRHWTHPVMSETLVDLLMIQKKAYRGIFAVIDDTFAGDGPGPRCMVPHVKNVILASDDQVAIDAVAAKLMGMHPMTDCKFVREALCGGHAADRHGGEGIPGNARSPPPRRRARPDRHPASLRGTG